MQYTQDSGRPLLRLLPPHIHNDHLEQQDGNYGTRSSRLCRRVAKATVVFNLDAYLLLIFHGRKIRVCDRERTRPILESTPSNAPLVVPDDVEFRLRRNTGEKISDGDQQQQDSGQVSSPKNDLRLQLLHAKS